MLAGADEEHDEHIELLLWTRTAITGLLQILNTKAMSKNVRIYSLIFSLRAAIKGEEKQKAKIMFA